ncbi:hypothetical protein E2C01_057152 [Portunus trituberculatus]|uniref:Uncharacterized protein n=1 Tax=Portunus trituberculatus TaxID=210409 RepID=A0A5B7GSN2_PORTR|nr:hypothetical protein [Portunus trituberculatus]
MAAGILRQCHGGRDAEHNSETSSSAPHFKLPSSSHGRPPSTTTSSTMIPVAGRRKYARVCGPPRRPKKRRRLPYTSPHSHCWWII